MQQPKLKCGLCPETFEHKEERREHEAKEHSAEVREEKKQPVARSDEEETAA
jgi:hypothetical protein